MVRRKSPARRRRLPTRWCYGGRRWSCDGEEGEEGELELHGRRTARGGGRATLTVEKLATAEAVTAARLGSDSGAWHLRTRARGHGWSGRRRRMRCSGRAGVGERASGAVGTADAARSGRHLSPRMRVRTAAHGSQSGLGAARRDTATDRRTPRVS
jgi:hypothetical protein